MFFENFEIKSNFCDIRRTDGPLGRNERARRVECAAGRGPGGGPMRPCSTVIYKSDKSVTFLIFVKSKDLYEGAHRKCRPRGVPEGVPCGRVIRFFTKPKNRNFFENRTKTERV